MTTLEQAIVEIIDRAQGFIDDDNLKAEAAVQAMEDILEAVKEEGYVNLSDRGGLVSATIVDSRGKTEYMTNQEWYDKFINELDKQLPQRFPEYFDAIEAARRASGIDG